MKDQLLGLNRPPFRAHSPFQGSQQLALAGAMKRALVSPDSILVVTGPAGVGKSASVRHALARLDAPTTIASVGRTYLRREDLIEVLLERLGMDSIPASASRRLDALHQILHSATRGGGHLFIVVEDVERLGEDALIELESLTAADGGNTPGGHLILQGYDDMGSILDSPRLARLRQRMRRQMDLTTFSEAETRAYVEHALREAGGDAADILDDDAHAVVYKVSGGTARLINNFGEALLFAAAEAGQTRIDGATALRVAAEDFGYRDDGGNGDSPAAEPAETQREDAATESDAGDSTSIESVPHAPGSYSKTLEIADSQTLRALDDALRPDTQLLETLGDSLIQNALSQSATVPAIAAGNTVRNGAPVPTPAGAAASTPLESPQPGPADADAPVLTQVLSAETDEPIAEPNPAAATEPAATDTPVLSALSEDTEDTEVPVLAVEAEDEAGAIPNAEPEPVIPAPPEPVLTAGDEPAVAALSEPAASVSPEPDAAAPPEPTAGVEPDAAVAAESEPAVSVEPEPAVAAEPAPPATIEPDGQDALEPAAPLAVEANGAASVDPVVGKDAAATTLVPDADADPVDENENDSDNAQATIEPTAAADEADPPPAAAASDDGLTITLDDSLEKHQQEVRTRLEEEAARRAAVSSGDGDEADDNSGDSSESKKRMAMLSERFSAANSLEDILDDTAAETLFGDEFAAIAASVTAPPKATPDAAETPTLALEAEPAEAAPAGQETEVPAVAAVAAAANGNAATATATRPARPADEASAAARPAGPATGQANAAKSAARNVAASPAAGAASNRPPSPSLATSPAERLEMVRALNKKAGKPQPAVPSGEGENIVIAAPVSIEDQFGESMTAKLKTLSSQSAPPAADSDAAAGATAKKGGLLSRFRRG